MAFWFGAEGIGGACTETGAGHPGGMQTVDGVAPSATAWSKPIDIGCPHFVSTLPRFGDKDVVAMVTRYTGACLGLFAFAVSIIAGLWAHHPPMIILTRSIWSLFVFCLLGLVVGFVAQTVINEYYKNRCEAMFGQKDSKPSSNDRGSQLPDGSGVGS